MINEAVITIITQKILRKILSRIVRPVGLVYSRMLYLFMSELRWQTKGKLIGNQLQIVVSENLDKTK